MKKIKMFAAVALFCAAAFAGYTAYEQATMTDAERMMQANLEALTDDDEGGAGCMSFGYKKWNTQPTILPDREEEFYDCLCNIQTGYDPEGC